MDLPEQFCSLGSSIYPDKQSHVKEPLEFTQFPFGAHGFVPLHSSLSVGSEDNRRLWQVVMYVRKHSFKHTYLMPANIFIILSSM